MHEGDYVAGNPPLNGSERLVVVSGCSGGGKSALLAEMARRGYQIMPEPGRQIVKEQTYVGGDGLPWVNARKFAELCVSRAAHFYNTARPGDGYVLFDRSMVDNICALARLGLPTPDSLRNALRLYRYAKNVYLAPPWEELFHNDAERRHPFADAVAEYRHLVERYPVHGYEVVELPKLGIRDRADFLEQQLTRSRPPGL